MQKFEYKVLDISEISGFWSSGGKFNYQEICDKLNELGRQGWEVVNATDINRYEGITRSVMIILKKQLNDNE